jgi:hypothetical protein
LKQVRGIDRCYLPVECLLKLRAVLDERNADVTHFDLVFPLALVTGSKRKEGKEHYAILAY